MGCCEPGAPRFVLRNLRLFSLPRIPAYAKKTVEKTIRKYVNYKEMKVDEYRYWQSRPVHERMAAVVKITLTTYALKGMAVDVPRLQGPLVRLQRPQR